MKRQELRQLIREEIRRTKWGNVQIQLDGKTYELAYPADGYDTPYGVLFPGENTYRFITRDAKAKRMWKRLKPLLDKQGIQESKF